MNRLYVLVGVPGSGKSTWIKYQTWTKDCEIVSTDHFVEQYAALEGKTYSDVFQEYMPRAVQLMTEQVINARNAQKDIVWDQTSCSIATRAKKIRMLPEYYKIAVVFKTPEPEELKRRLDSRIGKNIPEEVSETMARQLRDEPPTKEEGFDEIWYAQ